MNNLGGTIFLDSLIWASKRARSPKWQSNTETEIPEPNLPFIQCKLPHLVKAEVNGRNTKLR